jgi:predicted NBD/HSP70 family sugar kinase
MASWSSCSKAMPRAAAASTSKSSKALRSASRSASFSPGASVVWASWWSRAVAVPGLVTKTGVVAHAPNLGWREVDVAAELSRLLPEPLRGRPAEVDNEANLGALAELWHGAVGRDFVHVSASAGIGGALVANGMLLRGRRGFAGELGHMPVHPDGPACPCGSHGAWGGG